MMKYTHLFLIAMLVLSCKVNVFAQGAYVNVSAGFGASMSPQNLHFFEFYNSTTSNNSLSEEQVNVSFGKGLTFGATFGYMFNKNVGAELGVSYLLGSEFEVTRKTPISTSEWTFSANMLRFNPSLVVASGFERFNPYAKFGLLVGTGSVLWTGEEFRNGDLEVMKVKVNGGLALGLTSGIGAMYKVGKNISLFGELNLVSLTYAPTRGELIESTLNGVDQLPGLTTDFREIEFVDSWTFEYDNPPAETQPSQVLKQQLPFGSFGFNFGLNIRLSKQTNSDAKPRAE